MKDDETIRNRAAKSDCGACELKVRRRPKTPARHVTRSIHEGARDLSRDLAKTDAFIASRRARRKVEMLCAHMKKIIGLNRLRLRGPNGAMDEFTLAAIQAAFGWLPNDELDYDSWMRVAHGIERRAWRGRRRDFRRVVDPGRQGCGYVTYRHPLPPAKAGRSTPNPETRPRQPSAIQIRTAPIASR